MASLKERMALFNKASRKSDADDHSEFKKKSGNTEQPSKVGKLNHSYLSKDSGTKTPKRNFKIPFGQKKKKEEEEEKEEKAKPAATPAAVPAADTKPSAAPAAASSATPTTAPAVKLRPTPQNKAKPNRMQSARISMTGMLKNPFLANDKKGKAKVEKLQATKKENEEAKTEKKALDEAAKAEEEAERAEEEDQFAIPEGDEDAEDGDGAGEESSDKPKRGGLRGFVQQSQRLSLGLFARKKQNPTARAQSDVGVMDSKARAGAGIRLHQGAAKPPPRKSLSLFKMMGSSRRAGASSNNNKINSLNLVLDKSRAPEVEGLLDEISKFNPKAFTLQKRLSIRDNDIVQAIQRVIGNDPKQTSIVIDTDVRFNHLKSSMVQDFGDSIRKNLYLKTLTIRGVDLGNTFLEALASSIRDNVTLQEIDLSRNSFTHDALVEFCQALELNHTITTVRLQTQLSPVYEKSVETVLEAIEKNRSVKTMSIDFQGDKDNKYDKRLKEITQRNYWNKDNYKMPNPDDLLVDFLKDEVVRAEELHKQQLLEKDLEEVREGDWDYLYELSVLFDRFKLEGDENNKRDSSPQNFASPMHAAQSREGFGKAGKNPLTGAQGFPSDGSFLTEEFIDAYLQEDPEKGGLVFNFCNQVRLFKQFPSTSPDRETIVNIFVFELLNHPRQQEFTGINMTNTGCGDDFWVKMAEGVLEDPDLFPNINMISAETNFLTEKGVVAIANMIRSDTSLRYLQIVKLDNQKALLSSKAERALARAMCQNLSIIRFSLRVRNLLERDQCNKYVLRNIDFLRQARRHHKINTGTLKERKRNAMEQLFDSIAANDESIKEVNISADIKFTGLSDTEKVKSATAFATNSHVTKVTMNQLQLGDKFAVALGEALEKNTTIERLVIEGNAFTGAGFKGIFAGLGKNSSVLELLAKHQTKSMSSPDEQALPGLLEGNTTITKISLDLRNSAVTMQLDKVCNQNRTNKMRAEGTSERKRNAMEQFFDKIAEDDETITEVELSADVKFTGLSNAEKIKSAKAFATNSHVTKVTMNQLQLGDDFLIALGESLETNSTIERLVIEGNSFTGPGFKGLFSGLGKNSSVKELLGKHQTKSMSSADEQALPAFIEANTTLSKISLDLRNSAVTMALDKICNRNNQARRRQKNSSATPEKAGENAAAAVAATPAHLRDSAAAIPVPVPADEEKADEEPVESEEPVAEEKPFDEDVPEDEKTRAAVPPVEEAKAPKAVKNDTPFDERSADQPFDEAPEDEAPADEISPPDEVPMDEAPADESREAPADEDAPADEVPMDEVLADEDAPADEVAKASEPVEETTDGPTEAPESTVEETPDAEESAGAEEPPAEVLANDDAPADEVAEASKPAEETTDGPTEAPESTVEETPAPEESAGAEEPPAETESSPENAPAEDSPTEEESPEAESSPEEAAVEDMPVEEVTEPESSSKEAPATPDDAPVDEIEPESEPEIPAIVQAGSGDEMEITLSQEEPTKEQESESENPEPASSHEEALTEDTPTGQKAESGNPEPESSPEEVPSEDTPTEQAAESEAQTPDVAEAEDGKEIEVSAAPEVETAAAPEENPTDGQECEPKAPVVAESATVDEAEVAAAPEVEPEQAEESPTATAEATPAEQPAPADVEAGKEDKIEENAVAEEKEESPTVPEDAPAEEQAAEPETPADVTASAEAEESPPTSDKPLAKEIEPEPQAPTETAGEDEEVEDTAALEEEEAAPEEEADVTEEEQTAKENEFDQSPAAPEESPADEKEAAPEEDEEVKALEEESAQEVEVEPKPHEIVASADETAVEEIDGKSAESWDSNPNLEE